LFIFSSVSAQKKKTAAGSFENQWEIGKPIFEKGAKGSFDEVSVKDPSLIFAESGWHLFYTARGNSEYTTAYVSAKDLNVLNTAPRFELKQIRGKTRYGCAPQVFYFEPQKKWYLIYQNRDSNYQPVFSTNTEISKPELWTTYQNLIQKDSKKKWIDFWVIAQPGSLRPLRTVRATFTAYSSGTLKATPAKVNPAVLTIFI